MLTRNTKILTIAFIMLYPIQKPRNHAKHLQKSNYVPLLYLNPIKLYVPKNGLKKGAPVDAMLLNCYRTFLYLLFYIYFSTDIIIFIVVYEVPKHLDLYHTQNRTNLFCPYNYLNQKNDLLPSF